MKLIENSTIGSFRYQRYIFKSNLLHDNIHLGFLRPNDLQNHTTFKKTLFIFHGGDGDDKQCVDAGLPLLIEQTLYAKMVLQEVQIVLPFIDAKFLYGNMSRYFIEEIIPLVKRQTSSERESLALYGYSMGGQAALNVFFRFTSNFFCIGASFPTLITFHYDSEGEVRDFSLRTKVSDQNLELLISSFKNTFPSKSEFTLYDPLSLVKSVDTKTLGTKKIYLDVGSEDEFGLHEGTQTLHSLLNERGISHQFELIEGGRHDASFLAQQFPKFLHFMLS